MGQGQIDTQKYNVGTTKGGERLLERAIRAYCVLSSFQSCGRKHMAQLTH